MRRRTDRLPARIALSIFATALTTATLAQQPAAAQPQAQIARQPPAKAPPAPFPPLPAAQQQQLDQVLQAWELQSSQTKTLQSQFQSYEYDNKAPAGIPGSVSIGELKYAKPDRGMFRVDQKAFYKGMNDNGKPQHAQVAGRFGDYWVCNGKEVISFDREKKECEVLTLPPALQGKGIINSPLPFVFNLKAAEVKERYWVRQVKAPKEGFVMIEAWPKRQKDAAEYKLVQILLEQDTFLPAGLVVYAPNFDVIKTPHKTIYEFKNVKKNSVTQGLQTFMKNFIPDAPRGWKIHRDKFGA